MPTDPVCGMKVDSRKSLSAERTGKTYYFCSRHCQEAFLKFPSITAVHKPMKYSCHGSIAHREHHAQMVQDFKKRFWISMLLTLPILLFSPMNQHGMGIAFSFPGNLYVSWFLTTVIFFYGGWPFLAGAKDEIAAKMPGMMTLIGLAITVAFCYSSMVIIGLPGEIFFGEIVTLIDIMLLGHWIEMRSVMMASGSLEALTRLLPSSAHRILPNGKTEDVPIEDLKLEDRVLIKPGEKIPVDGKILMGESGVDESLVTGESVPVFKKSGMSVIGGSVNTTGSLTITADKLGKDSYLSQVIELVKKASESKSRAQTLADRAAFWLAFIALAAGATTFFTWMSFGKSISFSLERTVTVMIITCPHALGLAIPLVIAIITTLAARNGLLIRNRTAFENARKTSVIVFDKTGTLTQGEFGVTDILTLGSWSPEEILRSAASIENQSEHAIAQGICRKAQISNIDLVDIDHFEALPGRGAKAFIRNVEMFIGNSGILESSHIPADNALSLFNDLTAQGKTAVFVIAEKKIQGIIGLADMLRPEARETIGTLKDMGYEVAMMTGDHFATAEFIAKKIGIETFYADVLPDKKSDKIKDLQAQGKKVAMVGDGINDAPALTQADLGIAVGRGTDVAIESADIILTKNNLGNVADILRISKLSYRKTVENLIWATGYNLFSIPLAAGLLARYGMLLSPAMGAIVMSLSTVIVAINARLIRYHPSPSV